MTKNIHYAWWILLSFCAIQCGSLGLINNCRGIFYQPVCADMGFSMGEFTLAGTIGAMGSCLILPFVGRILRRYNIRIVLSAALVVLAATVAAMSTFQSLYQWYFASFFQGTASAFLYIVPAPVVLSNWFYSKRGTAVAISSAAAGITGVVMNPVGAAVIEGFGWRAGYLFFALLMLAIALPFTLFVIRYRPSDKGMRAYGYRKDAVESAVQKTGITAKVAVKNPTFWLIIVMSCCMAVCAGSSQFFSSMATSMGFTPMAGAQMISFAMAGNICGKLMLGYQSDRIGPAKSTVLGLTLVTLGVLTILTVPDISLLMAGAFFAGFAMAVYAVVLPLIARSHFDGEDYGIIYSYTVTAGTIFSSGAMVGIGYLYDRTGGYSVSYSLMLVLIALTFLSLWAVVRRNRSKISKAQPIFQSNLPSTSVEGDGSGNRE